MKFERKDIELLSPVGSYESLQAAIQAKADAVYLGIGRLNMRSHSSVNFSIDDLYKIVDICKENFTKCYVTLNSVMYDEDISEISLTLEHCKKAGIDAVVASDISVMILARKFDLPVHLSTQVNISNTEALKFFSSFAEVVVLARELNLNQVKNISNNIEKYNIKGPNGKPIRIEMFVHGALCMAISGKCYLSLHQYNHSANRGECFQICRRSYIVTDKETNAQLEIDNEYIMSPKDLCTIEFLDKILHAGARILKIEGRARSAEYVKIVTSSYNEAIQAIIEDRFDEKLKKRLLNEVAKVYNRGFWDGYYLGQKLGEWSKEYGSIATKKKVYLGKVINYFKKAKIAEVMIETGDVQLEDDILIIGPTTGVVELTIMEMKINEHSITSATKGESFTTPCHTLLRRNDKVYKWIDYIS